MHQQAMQDSSNVELRYELGQVALQLGKTKLADHWLRMALVLDPAHGKAAAALRQLRRTTAPSFSQSIE